MTTLTEALQNLNEVTGPASNQSSKEERKYWKQEFDKLKKISSLIVEAGDMVRSIDVPVTAQGIKPYKNWKVNSWMYI